MTLGNNNPTRIYKLVSSAVNIQSRQHRESYGHKTHNILPLSQFTYNFKTHGIFVSNFTWTKWISLRIPSILCSVVQQQ